MTIEVVSWALLGLGLGAGHIVLLRRSTRPPAPSLAGAELRLLLSGTGIVGIAWLGGLLPGAAGWAVGFAGALVWFMLRDLPWLRSKSSTTR